MGTTSHMGATSQRALITGATGFVGSAVVRAVLERGFAARVLARPGSDRRNLNGLSVEIADGDLCQPASLKAAISGCQVVFHVAADYRLWARHPGEIYRANIDGTVNLMQAASEAGVERVIYTSSVATLGQHRDGSPADETTPSGIADMIGPYKKSKFLAEKAVREMIAKQGLPAVIVNPSAPIGPRDIKPTPTGRMIALAARGGMPAYVDTGLNIVHVDDVAEGHMLALEKGVIGERYILGGENITLRQLLEKISRQTGHPAPKIRLPHYVVLPVGYIAQCWAWLTHGPEPMTTVDAIRMSQKTMFFKTDKARQTLGYAPRPLDQAIRDAVDWFAQSLS